jgi:hypothetical protein
MHLATKTAELFSHTPSPKATPPAIEEAPELIRLNKREVHTTPQQSATIQREIIQPHRKTATAQGIIQQEEGLPEMKRGAKLPSFHPPYSSFSIISSLYF